MKKALSVINRDFSMNIGIFLLSMLFFTVFIGSVFLIAGFSVNLFAVLIAFALSAAVLLKSNGLNKQFFFSLIIATCIFAVVIAVCGFCFDWSYDGNTYHKSIAGLLRDGWNPLKGSFFDFAKDNPFLSHAKTPWYDCYPKASELFGAAIYALTGNIECGKAFNLLSMFAAFFVIHAVLLNRNRLKSFQCFLIALLCSVNPIIIIQAFTYYNDGFIAELVSIFLFALLYFTHTIDKKYHFQMAAALCMSIGLGLNTKYSGLLLFGIPGIVFFAYWLYLALKRKSLETKVLAKRFGLLAGSVAAAIGIIGSNSYIINTIRYKNPLYVMIGDGAVDIINVHTPTVFKGKTPVLQMFGSLFSTPSTTMEQTNYVFKIPFVFTGSDLSWSLLPDTRVAGWGLLFSGIFLISIIGIAILIIKNRLWKKRPAFFLSSVLIAGVFILEALVIPGNWWARYFCCLFYLPAYLVLLLSLNTNHIKLNRILIIVVSALCILNFAPHTLKCAQKAKESLSIKKQLVTLSQEAQGKKVVFNTTQWFGRYYNFKDNGITNISMQDINDESLKTVFIEYSLEYRIEK